MFLSKLNRPVALFAKKSAQSSRCLQNKFHPLLLQWFPNNYQQTGVQIRLVQTCARPICPPKPCDCKQSTPELPSEKFLKMLMNILKLILFLAAVEVTWEIGLWSTSDVTQKLFCDMKYELKDILSLPNDEAHKQKTEEAADDKAGKKIKKERTLYGLWNLGIIKLFSVLGLHNHDGVKEETSAKQ